jgi:hypothetical protein
MKPKIPVTQAVLLLSPHFPDAIIIPTRSGPSSWAAWLIFPLQIMRQTLRNPGPLSDRALLALFQAVVRFPEGLGQVRFMRDRLIGRHANLIEYR